MSSINLLLVNEVDSLLRKTITEKAMIKSKLLEIEHFKGQEQLIDAYLYDLERTNPSYTTMAVILRSSLIQNIEDVNPNEVIMLDPLTNIPETISRSTLTDLFDKAVKVTRRVHRYRFIYNPYMNKAIYQNDLGRWFYNVYQPPTWQHEFFYDSENEEIPFVATIPPLYERFFLHLTNNSPTSYQYLIDWIANGLHTRNYCILTTIGKQGVGKGVLGQIMRKLFGESNSHEGKASRILSGNFNSQIHNKRFVYIDEIKIENQRQEDEIKSLVNNIVEVEKKGLDAIQSDNYANIYISSNNFDALKISGDDRRFSILDLTETRLEDAVPEEDIQSYLNDDDIKQLAFFLWHHGKTVDRAKMKRILVSERQNEVRDDSLSDWEEWLLNDYAIDHEEEEISLQEISNAVNEYANHVYKPGRKAIQSLAHRFPSRIKVGPMKDKSSGKRVWSIKFYKLDKKSN